MHLESYKKVLVFCAHTDDEIIGPGGTLARLSETAEITVVTATAGETGYSRVQERDKIIQMRERENAAAAQILGYHRRETFGYPAQQVPTDRDALHDFIRIIRDVRPDVIFTHWNEDKHRDHRAVSLLSDEARWKAAEHILPLLGDFYYTPELYYYEVQDLFSHPTAVVDISGTLEKKLAAMRTQESQLPVMPRVLQFIEGVARARGYMAGTDAAEAFMGSSAFLPQRVP